MQMHPFNASKVDSVMLPTNKYARWLARSLDRLIARSLDRSIARPLDRSITRSLDRSIDRSLGRSIVRSLDRSVARLIAGSLYRSLDRTIARSHDCSIGRPLDRSIERTLDRSITRSLKRIDCSIDRLSGRCFLGRLEEIEVWRPCLRSGNHHHVSFYVPPTCEACWFACATENRTCNRPDQLMFEVDLYHVTAGHRTSEIADPKNLRTIHFCTGREGVL